MLPAQDKDKLMASTRLNVVLTMIYLPYIFTGKNIAYIQCDWKCEGLRVAEELGYVGG